MTRRTQALHRLTTVEQVEAIIGRPPAVVLAKELDHLDEGCRDILAHSPVAGIGYVTGPDARPVSTFVGGGAGFAEMLGSNKISVPLSDGDDPPRPQTGISLVFLLPGVGEVLRLTGRVLSMASVVEIDVVQAFIHCAKAIHRSNLWGTTHHTAIEVHSAIRGGEPRALNDPATTNFLAACPFLVVSTWGADGSSDTSPRGDSPGFVQLLDANTVAIPDRKGNKRADTFHNLIADERISLAAVVPGNDLVLHLQGTGYISDDPKLLATMEIKGRSPHAALVIEVTDVWVDTNAAIGTSNLWRLARRGDEMPNMMALASQHVVIMTGRARKRSPLGAAFGLLAKSPRLAKAVADLTYKSELKGEGYAPPGATPEQAARQGITTDSSRGQSFRRLIGRLRLPRRETPGTATGMREVKVVDVIRETAAATTLILEDPSGAVFDFQAGQYFTVSARVGRHSLRRAYSASSAPGGKRCAVTIKQVNDGLMSTYLNAEVRKGARLHLLGPSGTFSVSDPASAPESVVLIAAGSGITPIMSILRTLLTRATNTRVALIYGNRTEDDIIFAGALTELAAKYPDRLTVRHILSRPSAAWNGATGRLEKPRLSEELNELHISEGTHFYMCGPNGVMENARSALIEAGVEETYIRQERFVRASDDLDVSDLRAQTMVVECGHAQLATVTVEPGATLLQAGLQARVPMPYSCTVGNCGDCMVKLVEGEVLMAEPNCLTDGERAEGYILACVGKPRSPVRIALTDE